MLGRAPGGGVWVRGETKHLVGPDKALQEQHERELARRRAERARTGRGGADDEGEDEGDGEAPDPDEYDEIAPDEEEGGGGEYYTVPFDYAYGHEFLRYMGWTREDDAGEQADDWVHRHWRIYQVKVRYGVLVGEGGGGGF